MPNLFKAFLPLVWKNSNSRGVQGLLHPESPYTETKAIPIRKVIYTRLRKHYQFVNELMLFPDIGHPVTFSVNVYGSERSLDEVHLISINDLFIPSTIKACRILKAEEERGKFFLEMEEGRRTEDGKWNTVGHPHRVIEITNRQLKTIASVFNDFPSAPKLPSFFNSTLLAIAEKFGESDHRVSDVGSNNMVISSMWHESGAKKDGYIKALPGTKQCFLMLHGK